MCVCMYGMYVWYAMVWYVRMVWYGMIMVCGHLTAEKLPDAGAQHLAAISLSGVWRESCSLELNLPPFSRTIDYFPKIPEKKEQEI